jgi:CheY-like chemotaxis protein
MRQSLPINILLVEDNPGDVRLTREAMLDARVRNELHVASDGMQALDYLRQKPPFSDAGLPDLILLDLNLPKKSGLEVLSEIKADDRLRRIPVVILTTSQAERDIIASYDRYVNAYIVKPVDLDQFVKVVKSIEDFWLEIVRLPAEGA